MIPSSSRNARTLPVVPAQLNSAPPHNFADLRDVHTLAPRRHSPRKPRRNREQQLIVLAAMQRKLERANAALLERKRHAHRGQPGSPNARADAASRAQPRKVGRKSVRDVHHRRNHPTSRKPLPQRDRRLRIVVRRQQFSPARLTRQPAQHDFEPQLRRAQSPSHKNSVARSRARPQHRPARRDLPQHGQVQRDRPAARRVSAGQPHPKSPRSFGHPPKTRVRAIAPFAQAAAPDSTEKIAAVRPSPQDR